MFNEKLQEKIKTQKKLNLQDLKLNIRNEKYMIKINNFCKENDFIIEDIVQKILNDEVFALFFISDPLKQNIAEKTQFEILKSDYPNLIKLSNQGKNAIYFGKTGITKDKKLSETKSLDFVSENTYFSAKYIKSEGGSQDNQFNDLVNFGKIYNSYKDIDFEYIAVISGGYFNEKRVNILKQYSKVILQV